MRYALRTRVLEPQVGQERWAGSITAAGGFETQSGVDIDPAATDAKEFGWAGYKCVTDADESPYCVGFAALARDDEAPFYGLAAQVRSSSGFAGTYATGVISLDAPADLPTSWVHGLVEVVVGSTSFGIYRVTDSNLVGPGDTGTITLETLAQNTTITIPAGAVTVYVLSGAEIGRVDGSHAGAHLNLSLSADESLTATPFDGVASARFTSAPEAIAGASPIVLALSAQTQDAGSVLIRGSRPDQGETFVVRADGRVAAKVGFRAPTVCATNYRFPSAASLLDFPIPLDVMKDDGAPFISGNYRPVWYRNPTGGWSLDPPNVALIYRALTIPLSGILPYGATVNSFKLYYETLSWLTDQSFRFQIYRRDAFDDSPTILQTTVLTAKASPGTLSITVSVPFQLTRSGATYAAHITSRNATDVTHADNIMVLHGVFASCTLKSLFPDS